ncbi:hypothetical protein [Aquabacterium sp.]|uniref:hypothetical protein n=1 Tax=Aquabacterium sp. TaxID=1872578 RepID=UPI002BAB8096|nr:hypothetical protein [Aquabacterium sp.]HSW06373.1 hypothetical protein [Aquabacterium sp.]
MVQGTAPLAKAIAVLRQSVKEHQLGIPLQQPGRQGLPASKRSESQRPSKVATLAASLAAIDPTDPQRRRKALRAFVEATLQDEFGSELIMSLDFQSTVDRTIDAMFDDPSLAGMLDEAAGELGVRPPVRER